MVVSVNQEAKQRSTNAWKLDLKSSCPGRRCSDDNCSPELRRRKNMISSMATTAEQFLPQRNPRREGELHGSE
jgi:hypothetical protein